MTDNSKDTDPKISHVDKKKSAPLKFTDAFLISSKIMVIS